jgi:CTP synthase (UTP-ammonia lyase)
VPGLWHTPSVPTVVVVGDHMSHPESHPATDAALRHAAADLGSDVEIVWMATATITPDTARQLGGVDAMLVAPGTYASPDGALAAIEVARTTGVPLLGTCFGMQHLVIELARNLVGAAGAAHAELDPGAADPWITELPRSLAGQTETVRLVAGTLAAEAYQRSQSAERYFCRFGIDPAHLDDLTRAGLVVSGVSDAGDPRIVELPDHPFFVGTLFVPQVTSEPGTPHPLLVALLARAAGRDRR